MTTPTHAEALTGTGLPLEVVGAERLAFECWAFKNGIAPPVWSPIEKESDSLVIAWMAWRDRATLAHHAAGGEAGR